MKCDFFPRVQQLLPVPAAVHVAEVLEPERRHVAGHEVQGEGAHEVVEAGDDGGGNLVSTESKTKAKNNWL